MLHPAPASRRKRLPACARGSIGGLMNRQQRRAAAKDVASSFASNFQTGVSLLSAGDHAAAEPFYRRALAARPGNPDCLHHLGLVAHGLGRLHESISLIENAVA